MKKLLYISLCALVSSCFAFDTDRVEEAIEQSSLSQVKSQCNKIDRDETMTSQARKKLYRNLYELAADATTLRAENISLFGNWRDVAKTGSGVVCAGFGLFATMGGLGLFDGSEGGAKAKDKAGMSLPFYVVGVASEALAAYLLYKGITCSTQEAGIDTAKSIEKYLKGKLNAEEPARE